MVLKPTNLWDSVIASWADQDRINDNNGCSFWLLDIDHFGSPQSSVSSHIFVFSLQVGNPVTELFQTSALGKWSDGIVDLVNFRETAPYSSLIYFEGQKSGSWGPMIPERVPGV